MDGYITIGTKLDNKGLEKGLSQSEKELEKFETEAKKLTDKKVKLEAEIILKENDLNRKIKEIEQKAEIKINALTTGSPSQRQTREDAIRAETQVKINSLTQQHELYLDKVDETLSSIDTKLMENAKNQEIVNKKIQESTGLLGRAKGAEGFEGIKASLSGIGSSLENVIKKVGRWALAVFGVRSAYTFIRRTVNTLSEYDDKLAADIEYIRFALASSLAGVINDLIALVYKLLMYTAYILKAWFGVNIFANASAKAFEKAKKSVQKTNKAAKELQKTLAGFDEMNILQDNGNTTTGGGGGGITLPTTDLSNWDKIKIPKWVQWIADHGKEIGIILANIAAIIATMKIAQLASSLGLLNTNMLQTIGGITLIVGGIALLATNLISLVHNWDELTTAQKIAKVALAVLGAAMIAFGAMLLGASGPVGAIIALVAVIGTLVVAMATEKKAIKDVEQAEKDLAAAKKKTKEANDEYVRAVDNYNAALKNLTDVQNKTKLSGKELYDAVKEGTLDYKNMTDQQKETYKAYLEYIAAQKEMKTATKELKTANQEEKMSLWEKELALQSARGGYNRYRDTVVGAYKDGKLSAKEAQELISKAMTDMDKDTQRTFGQNLPKEIKDGLDVRKYQTTWQKFKSDWKTNLANLITKVVIPFDFTLQTSATALRKKLFGFAKGGIVVPRLASGGIINQPGKGVPLSSAIGGERGAEGVIPLTDSQQMSLLGEAIGKYISINATIPVYVGNRQVSREMRKIEAEDNFAFNR